MDSRTETLASFLRSRRERTPPESLGLLIGRRRTPGLRREEVAQLAGISVTWYTWLEQGREVNPSFQVLECIAKALRLSSEETRYLFTLARKNDKPLVAPSQNGEVPVALQHILDHQGNYPAYIMGRFWDILAWNRAACDLFGDFKAMIPAERNMLVYMFVRPETRDLVVDWSDRAQRLIAEFRADCSLWLGDTYLVNLIDRLKHASPEFALWWSNQDVFQRTGGRRDFHHPRVGTLMLEQNTFHVSNSPELKLVLHVPLPESVLKLKLLHSDE